jgi:MerR family mercuric resistance operon transcriptional regulator
MQTYSIGRLAQAAGVPVSTVRYYERAGLLKPEARSGANYRVYSRRSLERLEFIRSAQAVGLSLGDVEKMLDVATPGADVGAGDAHRASSEPCRPCREVVALAERRLVDVREKLKHLRTVERTLAKAVQHCCDDDAGLCKKVKHLRKICAPSLDLAPTCKG